MSNWPPDNGGQIPPTQNPNNGWTPSGPPPEGSATAPRPSGGFNLVPLTIADVLDLTFSLLKKAWRQILLTVLVYAVPAGIVAGIVNAAQGSNGIDSLRSNFLGGLGGVSNASNLSAGATAALIGGELVAFLIAIGLKPFVQGAITRLVAAEYLGRQMTWKEAFGGVRGLYWRFVGASILVALCIVAGFVALVVGALVVAVLFSVVTPIIAIEEETVTNAMGRSWALMKRRFWSYLAIRAVVYVITQIAAFIFALIPAIIAGIFYAINIDILGGLFLGISQVLATLVALPISAIVVTLIYFDSRVRHEGFDLQMMAARLPQAQQPPSSPAGQ